MQGLFVKDDKAGYLYLSLAWEAAHFFHLSIYVKDVFPLTGDLEVWKS